MGAHDDARSAARPPLPLPPLLTVVGSIPLVARGEPWQLLDDAWSAARDGVRRVVLVPGEAGAGKTRLITEFARAVNERGGAVLYGTCAPEQSMPYQPFAEALDHLLAVLDPAAVIAASGADASELARLVPRRSDDLGVPAPVGHGDPDTERARLARAVIGTVAAVARDAPVLLVLDDLHWARQPTVELLGQLVREPTLSNVLVVCSYRSTPADIGEPLRDLLPDLRRLPGVERIPLAALDLDGIRDFVAAAAGHPVGEDLRTAVDVLARQTDGNPFLLVELWLHLVDAGHVRRHDGRWAVSGPLTDVVSPEGVRDVVAARLTRLEPATRDLLAIAAVVGSTFGATVLATTAGAPVGDVLAMLEPAVRSRIVGEDGAGGYRFAHELIRRSVYDELGSAERRAHHLGVARALQAVGVEEGAVAEIAHHLAAAVPLVEPREAVAAAERAAGAAVAAVAYDDAARFLEAALTITTDRRAELLLRTADATIRAGDVTRAKERCLEAHDLARRTGDPDRRIAAAVAYGDAAWRDARDGATAARLLRGVLGLAEDEATRVRLQAALTRALALAGDGDGARVLGEDALASARALDDTQALRLAFDALSYAPWTPATVERQLALVVESSAAARAHHDVEWENLATSKLVYGQILSGELTGARATAARHRDLADQIGQPLFRALDAQAHALLAMGEGRFADAEALAGDADELTRTLSGAPPGGYGVQLFSIRREQGRLDEARPIVEAVARLGGSRATWRPALAVMYAELGLADEAAAELRVLTADRLAAVPRDALFLGSLSYLADACCALGDKEAAGAIYDEMVGWRGLVVQVGFLLAAHGSVDRYLGELAELLGAERESDIHFSSALAMDGAAGMAVWLAHSQAAYGRVLAARRRPADAARASELLGAALATAERCGLPRVATAARAGLTTLGAGDGATRPDPTGLTDRELAVLRLVAEGRSNRDIGTSLHISQHTAANHIRSILMKTGCANRTEAAAWALRGELTRGG